MSSRLPSPLRNGFIAAAALAAGLFGAAGARAADMVVNPVAVVFGKDDRAETIELTNRADTPLRLEIRALGWDMRPSGDAPTEVTNDLIVYPQLLTIAPHATRKIRAALATSARASEERAYRLELNEIPPFTGPAHQSGMALTFVTRLLLAVYVPPASGRPQARLSIGPIRDGKVTVVVAADGNVHSRIHSIAVEGRSGTVSTSFEKSLDGATVLAGTHRDFAVDIPGQACGGTRAVVVRANVDSGSLEQTIPLSPHDCAP